MQKIKRINGRKVVLQRELEIRQGSKEAQQSLDETLKAIEQTENQIQIGECSTLEHIADLEYKINVAASEIGKWTDNSFMLV